MATNKVVLGDETLIDITDTTATEDDVLDGVVFYGADGEQKTGSVVVAPIDDELSTTSENPVQNKIVTVAINGKETSIWKGKKAEFTDEVKASLPSGTLVALTDDLNGNTEKISYGSLKNLPSINGVTIFGDKKSAIYDLASNTRLNNLVDDYVGDWIEEGAYLEDTYCWDDDKLWKCLSECIGVQPSTDDGTHWERISIASLENSLSAKSGFIDTSNLITSQDTNWTTTQIDYTATENCWCQYCVQIKTANYGMSLFVDGVAVGSSVKSDTSSYTSTLRSMIPIKKGQRIYTTNASADRKTDISIYGMA